MSSFSFPTRDGMDGREACDGLLGVPDTSSVGPTFPVSRINHEMSDVNDFSEGSFGFVKCGVLDIDHKHYAVKQTKKVISGEGDLQQRLQETYALSASKHPHILRYYDSWVEEKSVLVRTELLPEAVQQWDRPVPEVRVVALLHQVASALHTLHTCSIAHCDIKPSNILARRLDDGGFDFKLIDLGLARPLRADGLGTGEMFLGINDDDGDRNYLSPETLSVCGSTSTSVEATDVYALGATCIELMGGRPEQVREGIYTSALQQYSLPLQTLLKAMTSLNASDRPSAFDVARCTLSPAAQADSEVQECQRNVDLLRQLVEQSEQDMRALRVREELSHV